VASPVAATDSGLDLRFANGTVAELRNQPAGDGQVEFRYVRFEPRLGGHLIRLTLWGGPTTAVELYSACSGRKTVLDGLPVIASTNERFVTLGYGIPRQRFAQRVQVWLVYPSGDVAMEWEFELAGLHGHQPPQWGLANPRWTDEMELQFDRVDNEDRRIATGRGETGWAPMVMLRMVTPAFDSKTRWRPTCRNRSRLSMISRSMTSSPRFPSAAVSSQPNPSIEEEEV
jgi:hypothetical protein